MSRIRKTSFPRLLVLAASLLLAPLCPGTSPAAGSDGSKDGAVPPSPYADQGDVATTGLLPAEVAALAKGQGMAQALPAEVNDYPGPLHVLEAADAGSLRLEPGQRREVERIHADMHSRAVAKGQEVLAAEAELARHFRHRHIDAETLGEIAGRIAGLRGELRVIHLLAHLETRAIMTSEQVAAYRDLRGYDSPGADAHRHHHPR